MEEAQILYKCSRPLPIIVDDSPSIALRWRDVSAADHQLSSSSVLGILTCKPAVLAWLRQIRNVHVCHPSSAFIFTLFLVSVAIPSYGQEPDLSGVASVIDADTIEVHGQRIRLNGIDVPESDRVCLRAGERYPCGRLAALALDELINRRPVICRVTGRDRYRRALATCGVAGIEINDWLVRNGHAIAYRKYSEDYIGSEDEAHNARRGIWVGEFDAPWDWPRRKLGG